MAVLSDETLEETVSAKAEHETNAATARVLGIEWGRDMIDPDLWVNAWHAAVDRLPPGKPVVVEDCRFPNEAHSIRSCDGLLVRLNRKVAGIGTAHQSEQENFTPDLRLENNGTVTELCEALDKLIAGLEPTTMQVRA